MIEGESRITSLARESRKYENKSRPGKSSEDTNMKAVGGRKKLTKVTKKRHPESRRDCLLCEMLGIRSGYAKRTLDVEAK